MVVHGYKIDQFLQKSQDTVKKSRHLYIKKY
jgi:hypothetical protein